MPIAHVNDIDLNYIDTGEGEPLVMVHNLISSIRGFDFNIPVLSRYYRVIAHDQRGHGLSSKPEDGYNSDTMSDDLYEFLKSRGVESCYLLGCARIGVGTILQFFYKHPEMVKGLIPVSGGKIISPEDSLTQRGDLRGGSDELVSVREAARSGGMLAALAERRRNLASWIPKDLTEPGIVSRFDEMYQQTSVTAFLAFPETLTDERKQEIRDRLTEYPIPVLLIDGEVTARRWEPVYKSVCANFHHVILHGAGHYPAIESPDDFNMVVLNFLAGLKTYGVDHFPKNSN